MRFWGATSFCAIVGSVLAGCGGGSGGGAVSTAQNTLKLGDASIAYTGATVTPMIGTGSGTVTITALAGASFSSVSIVPPQTLDNCLIVGESSLALTTVNLAGQTNTLTGTDPAFAITAQFTTDGHIVFTGYSPSSGNWYAYECNWDGSNAQRINGGTPTWEIAWAPDNQKIAWIDPSTALWVSSPNGSNATELMTDSCYVPAFASDSQHLAFDYENSDDFDQIYTWPGSGAPVGLPGENETNSYFFPVWFPDGAALLYDYDSGTQRSLQIARAGTGQVIASDNPPSGTNDQEQASLAPDGKTIAFDSASAYAAGGPYSLVVSDLTESDPETVPVNSSNGLVLPYWSPYPGPQNFVGTGASMFSSAAGFIWGQNGDVMSGFVAFTTSAPSTTTVTQENGTGYGELVYDVHSKSITGLKYTNGYYSQIVNALPDIGSGDTDVLISFDSTTGQVTSLAPFVQTRTALKPRSQSLGTMFQARFSAVWDGKGHDLAPNGASQVVLDPNSGKPVSVVDNSGRSLPVTVPVPTPSPSLIKKLASIHLDPTKPIPAAFWSAVKG